ncbi:MAG: hypothetical protein ACTSVE_09530 [Candidatus Helarchaeota archaeon]
MVQSVTLQDLRKHKKEAIKDLTSYDPKNIIQVAIGSREVGGNDTGEMCYTVFVKRKRSLERLEKYPEKIIPKTITYDNKEFLVDVIKIDTDKGYRGMSTFVFIVIYLSVLGLAALALL